MYIFSQLEKRVSLMYNNFIYGILYFIECFFMVQVLVYVFIAYVNCDRDIIEERIYFFFVDLDRFVNLIGYSNIVGKFFVKVKKFDMIGVCVINLKFEK